MKLHDVDYVPDSNLFAGPEFNPYVPPPSDTGCSADGAYFERIFNQDRCQSPEFDGNPGSMFECSATGFKVYERTSRLHGARLDLKAFHHCIEIDRTYLLTARVGVSKSAQDVGNPTLCNSSGDNCLAVEHEHMTADSTRQRSVLWKESHVLGTKYGDVLTIATEVTFSAVQLDETNVYQIIRFVGLGLNEDMEIKELNLYLPPENLYPSSQQNRCDSLVAPSANAEHGTYSPFPFYPTHSWLLTSVEEDPVVTGNHFFSVRGRRDREKCGLAWDLDPRCTNEGANLRYVGNFFLFFLDFQSHSFS